MQQLLKPSLNFNFNDVLFEDKLPLNQQTTTNQKNTLINQLIEKDDKNKNCKTILRPQSSSGLKSASNQRDQNLQHKGVNNKQNTYQQIQQQLNSSKQVKFDKNQQFEITPKIQSNCYFPQQNTNQTNMTNPAQQLANQQQVDIKYKQQYQKQKQEIIQNAGIFDWDDDDLDNQFIISDNPKLKGPNKKCETIEKQNLEQYLQKLQKSDVIESSIKQNQELLKQQQKDIKQKLDNIEQLRMNDILQKNLVISQVPHLEDEEDYDDFKQDVQIQKSAQKNIEKQINEEQEYDQEKFEIDEENQEQDNKMKLAMKNKKELEDKNKQSQIKLEQVQENSKKVNSNESLTKTQKKKKKVVYRAKNAKERKQELNNMRSELEKYLLQNNPKISQMFQELQATQEKERIMVEVNTKRQEELSQARLTLKQLQEKYAKQQQIIGELDKKEHYANQIIQKLTENKQKYNQQWESQMEKYMACKVIARFLKGRKDRKLFTEFRRQSFINRLKQ
ncbi:unnamed protein product [Paramecium sonneborni]|uniref:Uncharacterized protein n=1 Tax=Paramecium sonneborni TaxID=65129 RepID=A0A8S1PS23_9CILI|nr:unnamed protein product [Paramecium sonneborni]